MANISVIIPCYNAEKTIKETIESVLAQTYQDFEVIVVDDGSTDGSKEIIQSFGGKVNYIFQENSGQSAARNSAIRASNGKFLAFIDADDLWLPYKLEKQLAYMESEKVYWCYCDCEYFLDGLEKSIGRYSRLIQSSQTGWVAEALLMGNFIASPTPIVSRAIFEKAGYFDECREIKSREDWEEWIRISMVSKIIYIPESLARYRIHKNSITYMEDPDKAFVGHLAVINKLCYQYSAQLLYLKDAAIANYAAIFSKSHFLKRNYGQAKKMITIAINTKLKQRYRLLYYIYSLPSFLLDFILFIRLKIHGE